MTNAETALFWAANFTQVALLGFQSRNINANKYAAAAFTSAALAAAQILIVKGTVALPFWTAWALIASSGAAGVVFGMFVWARTVGRR